METSVFLAILLLGWKALQIIRKCVKHGALAGIEFVSFVSACEIYEFKDNEQI